MTTDHYEKSPEYLHRMADDGMGGLDTVENIDARIASSFEDMGTVYTSEGSIPSTASIRLAGTFAGADNARSYLEYGGLIVTEDAGATVVPIGFVYFLREFDEVTQEYLYRVYIDEVS